MSRFDQENPVLGCVCYEWQCVASLFYIIGASVFFIEETTKTLKAHLGSPNTCKHLLSEDRYSQYVWSCIQVQLLPEE